MTQDFMAPHGFTPGTHVFAQWWSREVQAPFGTGLTDALDLAVGP